MGRLKALKPRLQKAKSRIRYMTREEADAAWLRARDRNEEWRKWYKTARWQKLRLFVLQRDGYRCQQTGVLLTGKYPAPDSPTVDHKQAHGGNPDLFWDPNNLQAVSKEWHDRVKQAQERAAGHVAGANAAGGGPGFA